MRTIAATTWSEYKKYFEKDPALARRFQLVKVDEPDVEKATTMMRGIKEKFEAAHDVVILDTAPTGHTLRLLMLPDLLDSWLGKLLEMRRGIARAGRLLRKLIPGAEAPPDPEAPSMATNTDTESAFTLSRSWA